MLLSLAGIPLTAGFLAKFYLVAAGAALRPGFSFSCSPFPAPSAAFTVCESSDAVSTAGSEGETPGLARRRAPAVSPGTGAPHGIAVWFGVYPSLLLHLIRSVIGSIF